MATLSKPLLKHAVSHPLRVKTASVAEAKGHLSSLLRSVENDHTEVVVERRGVPIAKIIPMPASKAITGFGWMKGSAIELGDIVGPTGEEWDVSAE